MKRLSLAAALLPLLLAPVAPAQATSTAADPVTRAVVHGALNQRVTLDGSGFRADTARRAPATAVTRRQADLLERSTDTVFTNPGNSSHLERHVVLSYVTVNASHTTRGQAGTVKDTHPLPSFHHRLAWVVFEKYDFAASCPAQLVEPKPHPLPKDDHLWRVFIVDAQDARTALQYDEPIGICSAPSGKPKRYLPLQYSDVAWTLVDADTIQVPTPDCGRWTTLQSGPSITVTVGTPVAHLTGCGPATQTIDVKGAGTATHGHVGLLGQPG